MKMNEDELTYMLVKTRNDITYLEGLIKKNRLPWRKNSLESDLKMVLNIEAKLDKELKAKVGK